MSNLCFIVEGENVGIQISWKDESIVLVAGIVITFFHLYFSKASNKQLGNQHVSPNQPKSRPLYQNKYEEPYIKDVPAFVKRETNKKRMNKLFRCIRFVCTSSPIN